MNGFRGEVPAEVSLSRSRRKSAFTVTRSPLSVPTRTVELGVSGTRSSRASRRSRSFGKAPQVFHLADEHARGRRYPEDRLQPSAGSGDHGPRGVDRMHLEALLGERHGVPAPGAPAHPPEGRFADDRDVSRRLFALSGPAYRVSPWKT